MGGLGGGAPQPPEAEIFENEINPPPKIRDFQTLVGGGFITRSMVHNVLRKYVKRNLRAKNRASSRFEKSFFQQPILVSWLCEV